MEFATLAKGGFKGMSFYFNLSTPVGKGYPNSRVDDVSFVQFCFVIAAAATNPPPPDVQKAWSKVTISGVTDEATLAGIRAWQAFRRQQFGANVDADGIISVVRTASGLYSPGRMSYDIVHLNFVVLVATAEIWPRLDKHVRCTPLLGSAIREVLSSHLKP
jgi:hypothetical protein